MTVEIAKKEPKSVTATEMFLLLSSEAMVKASKSLTLSCIFLTRKPYMVFCVMNMATTANGMPMKS